MKETAYVVIGLADAHNKLTGVGVCLRYYYWLVVCLCIERHTQVGAL